MTSTKIDSFYKIANMSSYFEF